MLLALQNSHPALLSNEKKKTQGKGGEQDDYFEVLLNIEHFITIN